MKRTLTIPTANLLFLISILLVLVLGSIVQYVSFSWGLIATEVFLIFLPAAFFLRKKGIPLREGLRLNPISVPIALLAVVLGVGTWAFTVFIDGWMMAITGQAPVSLPESAAPDGLFQWILYIAALAIFAPLCEEALFRGAIQGAYENHRSPVFAISLASLMFAFYHFRLTGLPALIPTAFILGYVVWRTQSLWAGVLVHFGVNFTSSMYTVSVINLPNFSLPLTSPWLASAGLLLALATLLLIRRLSPAPVSVPEAGLDEAASRPALIGWLRAYGTLVIAGGLYLLVSALSLIPIFFPELTAMEGVTFGEAPWTTPEEYRYQVSNRLGEVVGEAVCRIEPQGETVTLTCRRQVQAYEIQLENSYFSEGAGSREWFARWDAGTLALLEYTYSEQGDDSPGYTAALQEGSLVVDLPDTEDEIALLPEGALLEYEWPWRAVQVSVQAGISYKIPFTHIMRWDESQGKSVPMVETELLSVSPLEKISVPAGDFETWKVSIGHEGTAWYTRSTPSRLVQFDDGMTLYSLAD